VVDLYGVITNFCQSTSCALCNAKLLSSVKSKQATYIALEQPNTMGNNEACYSCEKHHSLWLM